MMFVKLHPNHIPRLLALVRDRKERTTSREHADMLREIEYRLEHPKTAADIVRSIDIDAAVERTLTEAEP